MLSEEQPERGRWGLARLAPAVLVAWVVVDLGLRAMPVERLGVSPIVAASDSPADAHHSGPVFR